MEYDYEKINSLKKKRVELYKKMRLEKDFKKRKKLELGVKILDLKMAIERLKQS